jgi:hypothetical protein
MGKFMSELRADAANSIAESPRREYDLVRSIALFMPDDHELTDAVRQCWESLEFVAPEMHGWHYARLLEVFREVLPESELASQPGWAKAVYILVTGGGGISEQLLETL